MELLPIIVLGAAGLFLLFEKALDFPSIVVTLTISYLIWTIQGFYWFMILMLFFVLAYAVTKIHSLSKPSEKHEQRTTDNIISNGLVAFVSALFGFPYMYLGSISAALADTMSSELGMLSKQKPFLITNLKKRVPTGTNGGITVFGTLCAFLGASIIGFLAFYFSAEIFSTTGYAPNPMRLLVTLIIAGVSGSLADSLFGALFENKKLLTNGAVNFIATITGGILTFLAMALF